jgi:hypothetical protein
MEFNPNFTYITSFIKKLPSSISLWCKQFDYFLVYSRGVCNYIFVESQNSQSIKTF